MCIENRAIAEAERHTGSSLKARGGESLLSLSPGPFPGGHMVPRGPGAQGPRALLATLPGGRWQGWPLEPRGCWVGAR